MTATALALALGVGVTESTCRPPWLEIGADVTDDENVALLSTTKGWPHDDVDATAGAGAGAVDRGSRFSLEVPGVEMALFATVKGSPHEEDCWVERPMRERSVVLRREDLRIVAVY